MLEATSFDENGQVMSLRHRTFDVRGVQFHPKCVNSEREKILDWLNS
jgi:anthranilate synthase component 2